jgi:hypothetical protein
MIDYQKDPNGWRYEEINCPSCSDKVKSFDTEGSAYFACANCQTYFKQDTDKPAQIIRTFLESNAVPPNITIGTGGFLRGKRFKVTGYIYKWDANEDVYWREYLLYNSEDEDYHVLAEHEGDWYLVWKADKQDYEVEVSGYGVPEYSVTEQDPYKKYYLYTGYYFHVQYAVGEFDTDIVDDEAKLRVEEYVAPPEMIVSERKEGVTTWYRGTYLPPSEVYRAFNLYTNVPADKKIRSNMKREQFFERWPLIRNAAFAIALLLALASGTLHILKEPKKLIEVEYNPSQSQAFWQGVKVLDGGRITVNGPAAVHFRFGTNVYNKWLELAVTMTNTKTGKSYEFSKVIEYYAGYEGGENWTEGSQEANAVLSRIPSGTYQINIYPTFEAADSLFLVMQVEQDPTITSNLWLCLALVLAYPVFQWIKKDFYEM